MLKIVLLILMVITKDGDYKLAVLPMPPGTTIADCEANHTPALDNNVDSDVVKFGYKYVELEALPTSGA